jgi:mRNA interferase MazF
LGKAKLPTHIDVYAERFGLVKDSVILLEQIRTIDKTRLREKMGHIDDVLMQKVNNAITISFGLDPYDVSSRETDAVATQTIG